MNNHIIYEQPLSERMRTFLRIESLFRQLSYFLQNTNAWDTRATLSVLMEILAIFDRIDIKNETIKELERYTVTIDRLAQREEIDQEKLEKVNRELTQHIRQLQNITGKI